MTNYNNDETPRTPEDLILENDDALIQKIGDDLGFAPDEIKHGVKVQYFGDYNHGKEGSGWLVLKDDPQRPWAMYGNLRKGKSCKFTWKGKGVKLTPEELEAWEKRHEEELRVAEKELEELREQATEDARNDFGYMPPADPNNYYLLKKKVGLHGDIRQCNCRPIGDKYDLVTLVIPVCDIKGEIISLQFVNIDGKWFKPDTTVKGGMHLIGPKITDIVIIVEGYATGASIFEMTGLPVAVAFDAGNLLDVARELRAKFPEIEIVIAGDNDLFTEKDKGYNTGRLAAEEAAESVGGAAILPCFDASELKGEKKDPTDWNDLAALHGNDAAGACFMLILEEWRVSRRGFIDTPEQPAPRHSEADLAKLFDAEYGHRVRFVAEFGKWFYWNGKVWKEDKINRIFHYARKVCERDADIITKQGKKSEQGLARGIASAKFIAAVVKIAQSLPRIASTSEQWDNDPWLLNTPNGVVDLRTGKMRPHRPDDYMTKCTGVSPSGACPKFMVFLGEITNNDLELIAYLQRKNGYTLTGVTVEHVLFFSWGEGGNGKSVYHALMDHVMGDYSMTAAFSTFTVTKFEQHLTFLATLRGARRVRCSEVSKGQQWDEGKIKDITGGDPIRANLMRQDPFTFTPQFKLECIGNSKPSLRTVDAAIKRRIQMIPHNVCIALEKIDKNLADRLREEGPGILQWLIDGCVEWQRIGLKPPATVVAATNEYLKQQDAVETWLEECCERNSTKTPSTIARLMTSWTRWAQRTGEAVGTRTELIEVLLGKRFEKFLHETGTCFRGLRLTEAEANATTSPTMGAGNSPSRDEPRPNFAGPDPADGAGGNGAANGADSDVHGPGFTMPGYAPPDWEPRQPEWKDKPEPPKGKKH
jgi:putative DNA primase/helicase